MLPEIYKPALPPFKHQEDALIAGWEREGYAYLLEMGLGKSRVTVDNFALLYEQDKVDALLIIAPKSVYTNWTRMDRESPGEVQKWLWPDIQKNMKMYAYRAGRKQKDTFERKQILDSLNPGPRILAMNIEALSSTVEAKEFAQDFLRAHRTMIVIDESTTIKNPKSVRTETCIKLARLATYRRILTGSPSTGSLSDLWAQFEFLGPGQQLLGQRLFTLFRARYCTLKELNLPGRSRPVMVETGSQNVEELADIMARHSFRRRKKDCLDLPEKVFLKREVELTDAQEKAYKELKRTAMTVIRDTDVVTTDLVITQLMRMHQVICGHIKTDDGRIIMLESNRIKVMMEIIEQADINEQCVIWCMYVPDVERVARHLIAEFGEDQVSQWYGKIPQNERERGEKEFQAGRARFMVANKAGARGRTWTNGTLVIYYSNDQDLEIRIQSEDRTHRIGTTGTVTYFDLIATGTLDEKIVEALRRKLNIASAVMREGIENWI